MANNQNSTGLTGQSNGSAFAAFAAARAADANRMRAEFLNQLSKRHRVSFAGVGEGGDRYLVSPNAVITDRGIDRILRAVEWDGSPEWASELVGDLLMGDIA